MLCDFLPGMRRGAGNERWLFESLTILAFAGHFHPLVSIFA